MAAMRLAGGTVVTVVASLVVAGVLLFAHGFLLRRTVAEEVGMLPPGAPLQRYERLVLVVIDALRYDFVAPQPVTRPYTNRFQAIHAALADPTTARLYRFEADAPTTTLQRLQGLMTGSLPTFIDMRNNFGSSAIAEDSLVHQWVRAGRRVALLGDDTWLGCFPGAFVRAHGFPSFDVWDLDTVDDGVLAHLNATVADPTLDVVIAHFLGVDHGGHRYGPHHPEMTRKLEQMNEVVAGLMATLPSQTLLVVLGDHGMTAEGDHGGDTAAETGAALFVYAHTPPLVVEGTASMSTPTVQQIDLVPTLALLLGHPIPFGSLGAFVPELVASSPGGMAAAASWNVRQVVTSLAPQGLGTGPAWAQVHADAEALLHADVVDPAAAHTLLRTMLALARASWAQFDVVSMAAGLAVVVAATLVGAGALIGSHDGGVGRPLHRVRTAVAVVLVAIWAGHFGSNSLVVAEGSINLFLTATAVAVHAALGPRRPDRWLAAVVALVGVRASGAYILCREEHGPACVTTFGVTPVSAGMAAIALLGPPLLASSVWRSRRARQLGPSHRVARAEGLVLLAAALTVLLWQLPADARRPSLWVARVVYVLLGASMALVPSSDRLHLLRLSATVLVQLLAGPAAVVPAGLVTVAWTLYTAMIPQDDALAVVGALLLGQRFFFATGQQAVVSAIRWGPGFVGVDDARLLWLSGALVTLAFFAGPLLAVVWAATPGAARQRALLHVLVVRASLAVGCLVATLVLRRHLMLWKVFAPRFLVEGVGTVLVAAVAVGLVVIV